MIVNGNGIPLRGSLAGVGIYLVSVAALALPASALAQALKDVVENTLRGNPVVTSAAAQKRAAQQDVEQARAGYLPSLDVSGAYGKEHTDTPQTRAAAVAGVTLERREAGVGVTQKLFDGFATKTEIERQNARFAAATSRLDEVRETVALRTSEVYLDVLRNRELVKLANDNVRAHMQMVDKVRLRVQGGVSQKADLQQALGRLALARSVVAARAGKLREAESNYLRVVGQAPGDLTTPTASKIALTAAGALDREKLDRVVKDAAASAVNSNPSISIANAEVAASEAAVRNSRSAYWPRVNLEATANRNHDLGGIRGSFSTEALMLTLRWNLFRGGGDRAQERSLTERRYAAIDAAADKKREVEERVAVALHGKASSEERLGYLDEHVKLSLDVLDSYKQQLELGRRTLLDVLNAENELFTARSNYVAGRYDDVFAQYSVEAAKGLLVKSLGIAVSD